MILLTGATGYVGNALADVLGQGRRRIVLFARRSGQPMSFEKTEVSGASGDVTNAETLALLPAGIDSILHLAGATPGMHAPDDRHEVRAMQALLAFASQRDIDRFVFLSATGADPKSPVPWLRNKGRAEELLRQTDLDWVILRAGPIFDPEDRFMNAVAQVVDEHASIRIPLLGNGSLRPIAVGDVSIALAMSLDHHVLSRRVLDVGGDEVVTLTRLLELVARRMGNTVAITKVPFRGISLERALERVKVRPLTAARTWLGWFTVGEDPDVSEYKRAIPMRRTSFEEELRSYAWGPPPPRPGDPLPVIQPKGTGLPLFIPGAHLRDDRATEKHSGLGRVDPFGRPESGSSDPYPD